MTLFLMHAMFRANFITRIEEMNFKYTFSYNDIYLKNLKINY